jgi:hypothetical protein
MKKRIAAIKMQLIISLFLFLIKNRELFFQPPVDDYQTEAYQIEYEHHRNKSQRGD